MATPQKFRINVMRDGLLSPTEAHGRNLGEAFLEVLGPLMEKPPKYLEDLWNVEDRLRKIVRQLEPSNDSFGVLIKYSEKLREEGNPFSLSRITDFVTDMGTSFNVAVPWRIPTEYNPEITRKVIDASRELIARIFERLDRKHGGAFYLDIHTPYPGENDRESEISNIRVVNPKRFEQAIEMYRRLYPGRSISYLTLKPETEVGHRFPREYYAVIYEWSQRLGERIPDRVIHDILGAEGEEPQSEVWTLRGILKEKK